MTKKLHIHLTIILIMLCCMAPCLAVTTPDQLADKAAKERQREMKTQIKNIKEALKGKRGADALKGVENIRKDSAEMWNTTVLQYGVDACRLIADGENEKLYLKNNPDTTAFFNALYNIGHYALLTDSAETIKAFADSMEGKATKYRFRKANAALVSKNMGNILIAPRFFAAKGKWEDAERLASMGIDLMESNMLKAQKHYRTDTLKIVRMAVIHANACYNLKHHDAIERYAKWALMDSIAYESIMERLVYAETERGDTASYFPKLVKGHRQFPYSIFFFSRLNDYYIRTAQYDHIVSATRFTLDKIEAEGLLNPEVDEDTLIRHKLTHENIGQFYETLAIASHNQGKFRDCINQSNNVLKWNPQHPRADFFIGASYFRMAEAVNIPESVNDPNYKKNSQERDRLLEMARPHMEIYRKNNPEESRFWAPLLYEIYLYLNLGEEFEEILKYIP